ncbi:hypothetical protein Q7P37_006520 [Cladosporium fusiforme]
MLRRGNGLSNTNKTLRSALSLSHAHAHATRKIHNTTSSSSSIHTHAPRTLAVSPRTLTLSHQHRRNASTTATSHTYSHDIAILGGGISGLATAYFVTQQLPRAKVTVYEAGERIGGWLEKWRFGCAIQELDLGNETIFTQNSSPAATNRFLYYPDRLVRMPHPSQGFWENFHNIWAEPVFDTAMYSAAAEFFREPRDSSIKDESLGSFFSRRFSKTMVDRILSGMTHGIWAGDAYKLSARSLFTRLYRDEVVHGGVLAGALKTRAEGLEMTKAEAEFLQEMKGFKWDPLLRATLRDTSVFTFKDGMGTLVDKLARKLWEADNVEVKTSTPVKALALAGDKTGVDVTSFKSPEPVRHDVVISALSPAHLNALAPPSTTLAPETPSVSVMTVNLYYSQPDMHPAGFGYLIPLATPFEQNPERALGVVFDTAYSPSNADTDTSQWTINDMEELTRQREGGRMINVNDFSWFNFPHKPVVQDDVPKRGTKVTVMLGGHWWDGWPAFPSEQEGLEMARSVLSRQLGIHQEPQAWAVNLQKDAIPQYHVGHDDRLKAAHATLLAQYQGKLRVAGNWIQGVGVNDCLRSAWDVVKGLRDGRDATGLEMVGSEEYVKLRPVRIDRDGKEA